jgi:hypothetical protein
MRVLYARSCFSLSPPTRLRLRRPRRRAFARPIPAAHFGATLSSSGGLSRRRRPPEASKRAGGRKEGRKILYVCLLLLRVRVGVFFFRFPCRQPLDDEHGRAGNAVTTIREDDCRPRWLHLNTVLLKHARMRSEKREARLSMHGDMKTHVCQPISMLGVIQRVKIKVASP